MTTPAPAPAPTYLNKANLDLKWDAEAQTIELNALKNVKAKADDWLKYLPFLLAPLNIVAAWIGSEAVKTLSFEKTQLLQTGLVAIALLSIAAYWIATLAAQVAPKEVITTGAQYRRFVASEAQDAASRLNWSRFLTLLVALLLVGVAASTRTWVKPEATPQLAYFYQEDGPALCGAMLTDPSTGQLRIQVGNGKDVPTKTVTPQKVTEIKDVTTCPALPEPAAKP